MRIWKLEIALQPTGNNKKSIFRTAKLRRHYNAIVKPGHHRSYIMFEHGQD